MVYSYTYGRCETEQDAVSALDDFLVNTIGWTRVDTVVDTSTDRDYVWKSDGEADWVAAGGDPIYIRVRGYADEWICSGYRTYTNSTTYTFQILHNNDTHVDLSSSWLRYWFYGDKNFVCCLFYDESNAKPLSCYLGLIRSYYDIERDDYPMLIKGHLYYYYSWTYYEGSYMHDCTTSGQAWHENMDWWSILQYDTGVRSGNSLVMLPTVVVNRNTGAMEMRGEPYGVYQVNGKRISTFDTVATSSGVYLAFKFDDNDARAHAFGPVASGVAGFDMWDGGDVWRGGTKS